MRKEIEDAANDLAEDIFACDNRAQRKARLLAFARRAVIEELRRMAAQIGDDDCAHRSPYARSVLEDRIAEIESEGA